MEDVDFVRRAHRAGSLFRSPLRIVTSARRWERDGWIQRTARHLALITLYFCGVSPSRLIRLDRARSSL
jgi:GT2 family glycosyltransferase